MSIRETLDRLRGEDPTPRDAEILARYIHSQPLGSMAYEALHALGHTMSLEYRDLVAAYLTDRDRSDMYGLALSVLCQWGLGLEYEDQVAQECIGDAGNPDVDLQLTALSCAGIILADANSKPVLHAVLRVFDDRSRRLVLREAAYAALLRADGKRPSHRLLFGRALESEVDTEVIDRVRKRLT